MQAALVGFEPLAGYFRFAPAIDFAHVPTAEILDAFARLDRDTQAARRGAPLRVLCDVRRMANVAKADRNPIYERHHEFLHRRVAVVGDSRIHQILFDFLTAATSFRGQARYFVDEAAAIEWVRGDDGR